MKKFRFEKLVRDNLPETIKSRHGSYIDYSALSHDQLIQALKIKLIEEAQEVLDAKNNDEIHAEIADVIQVLLSLHKHLSLSIDKIEQYRLKKLSERGSFDKGIYCHYAHISELDTADMQYFLDKPNEYPEIPN